MFWYDNCIQMSRKLLFSLYVWLEKEVSYGYRPRPTVSKSLRLHCHGDFCQDTIFSSVCSCCFIFFFSWAGSLTEPYLGATILNVSIVCVDIPLLPKSSLSGTMSSYLPAFLPISSGFCFSEMLQIVQHNLQQTFVYPIVAGAFLLRWPCPRPWLLVTDLCRCVVSVWCE